MFFFFKCYRFYLIEYLIGGFCSFPTNSFWTGLLYSRSVLVSRAVRPLLFCGAGRQQHQQHQPLQPLFPVMRFFENFFFFLFYYHNFSYVVERWNWGICQQLYRYRADLTIISYNLVNLYFRWTHFYWLLFNLFYYQTNFLFFGTIEYRRELLALNWFHAQFTWELWKYINYWFILKTSRYNKQTRLFFNQLQMYRYDFFLIIDPIYHFRLLNFIQTKPFNTVGLVPLHLNPWLLTIPLIVFELNFFIQFYLLYFTIAIQRAVCAIYYSLYTQRWLTLQIHLHRVLLK